ncbi:haloacid dehalogenase superfamily, subfamily IA, variant 3 with third motif having DD or ED [Lachnospiraceae bacterium NE2001]|nr:haloacid dehalogenase superfamily, subfamily IA, variant 3 with third motif having DD or ED [Lachnospiraceae bacterium NE2001]
MFKYVIFDMDGVIFDSERLYIDCTKEVAVKFGITDPDVIEDIGRRCIGTTSEETLRIMRESLGDDFPLDDLWVGASSLFKEKTIGGKLPIKPGVSEILEYLKEKKIWTAIASSTKTETVKRELNEAGFLDYFDAVIGGDMIQRSKPAPDSFLKAMEALGAKPEECCIIEDSFNGIRAANASGAFPIMVPDILQPDEEIQVLAGIVLDSLYSVKEYFETL